MQRSYERRRWRRDGGRGGAGLSRRGACCKQCCCGISIAKKYSLLLGRRQREQPPTAAAFFSFAAPRPQAGDENTPPPLRIAPQAPAGNKGATRERIFFCDGLAAWRPMPGGFFFSPFLLRRRRPADERSRARQTRTSGVPVPTWPIICAALRAISSRSQNRGKTLRFSAQVAWNGKSSGAMRRCRQAQS